MGVAQYTEIKRYFMHNGDEAAWNGTLAGFHVDTSGVQYPDNWGINVRIAFTTDSDGASRVAISGLRRVQVNENALRMDVTQSADAHIRGSSTDGVEIGADGSGYTDVKLQPNTRYYLWLFCNGWSHLHSDDGDILGKITVSGAYGTAAVPSAADGTFGRAIPIRLTGGFPGAQYTVEVTAAGKTETLLDRGTDTSLNWTPAVSDYAPLLPRSGSARAAITVRTFYGALYMGENSVTITVSFAINSIGPILSRGWATAAVLNEGAAAGFSVYIQGYSRARLSFDPSKIRCRYGADIAGYVISCNGIRAAGNPCATGVLPGTAASIVCTVYDSRGQSSSETLTVSLEPYARPSLAEISVYRSNTAGSAAEDGDCVAVRAKALFSALGGENSVAMKVYVRAPSGSFGEGQSLEPETRTILRQLSPDTAYEIKMELTDALGNVSTALRTVPTRSWAMKFRPDGRGVAFGKAAETDRALELPEDWTLKFGAQEWLDLAFDSLKARILQATYPVGAIYMSTSSRSPAALFGGTWTPIAGRFLLAAGGGYTAGDTGGEASHSLTENEMPPHRHSLSPGALGWPEDAYAGDHHVSDWGVSAWPKVSSVTLTENTGGGAAHNNMPPYLVVYVWKRTA